MITITVERGLQQDMVICHNGCSFTDVWQNLIASPPMIKIVYQVFAKVADQRGSSAARRMILIDRNDVRAHLHEKIGPIPAGRRMRAGYTMSARTSSTVRFASVTNPGFVST